MNRWCFDLKLLFETYIIFKLTLLLKFDLLVFFLSNLNTDSTKYNTWEEIHVVSSISFINFNEKL